MLEKEFNFFKKNHDALFARYPDKYLVIKGEEVLFYEDTFDEALQKALQQKLEIGTFLIQLCSEGNSAYTQTFHSRAIFA